MTHDQIDRMVRQANPVPDLKALEPVDASVLVLDQQGRTEMQTNDRVKVDQEQKKPRRGLLIGVAAAIAAIVAVGFLILLGPGDDAPVADQPSVNETASPVEIATAFFEAFATFDAGKAASYLTAGAFAESAGMVESLSLETRFWEVQGFKLLLDSCEERASLPSGAVVRCTYDYHALRSDEMGLGPFSGSWYDFTVEEGRIVQATGHLVFMENDFSAQVWEPFADWLRRTYPDDVAIMYIDFSQSMYRLSDESIGLWEQRSREYVEVVKGASG